MEIRVALWAVMGWVGSQSLGIYGEKSWHVAAALSQIHEHVGVEGQNHGIFCRITGALGIPGREGCEQLNQAYDGLESNNNQKHWGPGMYFRLSWKCFLFSWMFLLNVVGILGTWSQGAYWGSSSRRSFFFQAASEFVSLLGWVTPLPSPAALGAPGNGISGIYQV